MPPNIAFLVSRSAELKAYAPVIVSALRKNLPAYLLCGPDPKNSWPRTPLYQPLPDNMLFPGHEKVSYLPFLDDTEATKLLEQHNITDLFILRCRPGANPPPRPPTCRLRALQFMADYLYVTSEFLGNVDTLFTYSPKMSDIYHGVYPDVNHNMLATKLLPVGNPILDALPQIKRNSTNLRQKYNLPPDKPIVLLLSLNIGTSFWKEFVFGSPTLARSFLGAVYYRQLRRIPEIVRQKPRQKEIIAHLKKWCRRQGAALVIKSRAKHDEPQYVVNAADHLITDNTTWFPYITLELLSIADLTITFNSTSVLEAAACGTYTISLDISQDDNPPDTKGKKFLRSGIYDNPAVARWPDYHDFPDFLQQHKLSDFSVDPAGQQNYLKTFLGPTDGQAADRIINHVCASPQSSYSRLYSKTHAQLQNAR